MPGLSRWRHVAGRIKTEINVYRRVLKHPRTPRLSRWLLALALIYLLSPIDFIPDWVPVLGQLDDLLVVPLLVMAALRRIPADVIEECRQAEKALH